MCARLLNQQHFPIFKVNFLDFENGLSLKYAHFDRYKGNFGAIFVLNNLFKLVNKPNILQVVRLVDEFTEQVGGNAWVKCVSSYHQRG